VAPAAVVVVPAAEPNPDPTPNPVKRKPPAAVAVGVHLRGGGDGQPLLRFTRQESDAAQAADSFWAAVEAGGGGRLYVKDSVRAPYTTGLEAEYDAEYDEEEEAFELAAGA
jgi:hypothetical protein